MLATRRGVALVRRTSPQPANDNVPGTITPDDRPFFLALTLLCVAVLALVAFLTIAVPDDVMATFAG